MNSYFFRVLLFMTPYMNGVAARNYTKQQHSAVKTHVYIIIMIGVGTILNILYYRFEQFFPWNPLCPFLS